MKKIKLSYTDTRKILIEILTDKSLDLDFNKSKTILTLSRESQKICRIISPLLIHNLNDETLKNPLLIAEEIDNYYIILIQAGHSALAYCEGGEMIYHKVITKYMVRKGQGSAQIKHLKTKGKSREGSRIRLAKTIEFFEEINHKLNTWFEEYKSDQIFYSSSVDLWNIMFESKVPVPFEKRGDHLIKIPLDINKPGFKELKRVNYFLMNSLIEVYSINPWFPLE